MKNNPAIGRLARFQPAASLRVTTLEQVKTLSDPLRLDMLEVILNEAHTVKQIATLLGVPPTKLYYHMKALEAAGFARVVDTRVKSGIIEKYYRRTARIFPVDPNLFAAQPEKNGPLTNLLTSMLEATADDVSRSADAGLIQLLAAEHSPSNYYVLKRGLFKLRPRDVPRFVAGFNALIDELDARQPAEGDVSYGCTVAFYPRVGSAKPRKPRLTASNRKKKES